jgi:hypothetical protein
MTVSVRKHGAKTHDPSTSSGDPRSSQVSAVTSNSTPRWRNLPSLPACSSRTSTTSTSDDAGSTASSGGPTVEPLKNAPPTPGSRRANARTQSTATARA